MNKKEVRLKALKDSIPVFCGYEVLGIGFGLLLKSAGYGLPWAAAMSIFIFAGSMQYVGVTLLSGGMSLFTVALTTLMVNARHLFYGISMIDKYRHVGHRKPYLIFALTDETYSLVCKDPEGVNKELLPVYYLTVSLANQIYWVTGSLIGSAIGTLFTFDTTGIDFSLTALFLVIVTDQWLKTRKHYSALIGAAASVACLLIFGADSFLIPTMIVITAALFILKKIKGEEAYD